MAKPSKVKTFTEHQLARLPAAGYWVGTHNCGVDIYCVMNGKVKYIHHSWGGEWGTLLWSCCPTRKQIAAGADDTKFEHFVDHASMLAKYPEIKDCARVKAPNDV